jgi:hypothetical protein
MENTQNNIIQTEDEILSTKIVAEFTRVITDIIDDRIRKRLLQEDMIKVYDAEIIDYITTTKSVSYNVTEVASNSTATVTHNTPIEVVSSITVKYDNDFEEVISNTSVQQIPIDYLNGTRKKWVKICTYDGVQFYVLHTL